jgi:hypothetical protein
MTTLLPIDRKDISRYMANIVIEHLIKDSNVGCAERHTVQHRQTDQSDSIRFPQWLLVGAASAKYQHCCCRTTMSISTPKSTLHSQQAIHK